MPDDPKPDELAEGTAPERPDWLPDNFTDPTALVESYQHSQRKITEQGNELSNLRGQMETLTESLQTQQQQQYQPPSYTQDDLAYNPLVIRAEQARAMGNTVEELRVFAEIAQAAAQQAAQQNQPPQQEPQQDLSVVAALAEQQTRAANPDYDEYEARAMEILTTNPHLFPDKTLQGVLAGTNAALNIARGEAASRDRATLAQQQAQQETDRQRKLDAQTVQGGGTRPPSPDAQQAVWEQIKNAGDNKFRPTLAPGQ